ncbi:ABC transporter permease [Paenibacillus sp. CAA11]|uniref:ABC transporter permease n=1 Tax=Paenibacillus sp. CAA11 TaxID=1532905 RepID=UPI000D37821F|nr:ABC transporter permease [Paenibacillus sp. CAA11]AWB43617.1 ABC transporter permease [Paenibacillus sp. CAA11]
MSDYLKLIQNENMKIYRRLRTWIMVGITLLIPLLLAVVIVTNMDRGDISAWEAMDTLNGFYLMVSIFSAIVFADIVAAEFTWGTIKLLLIRPWKRTKILASKLLAALLFALFLSVLFFGFVWIISFLLFPTEGVATSDIFPSGYTPLAYTLESMLYRFVDMLVIAIFAFMLSAVFRSGGLAIGLSIFLFFAGNIFRSLLDPEVYSWSKYVLFTNMGLSRYMFSSEGPAGMTLGFSATMLAIYVILFLALSWLVFNKRDVAA